MPSSGDESPGPVDLTTRLVDEFRGRLDESLILTIAGDFDLTKPTDWDNAKATLAQLAESAVLEELSGFNHSGVASADLHNDLEALDLNGYDGQTTATESSQPQTVDSESSFATASLSGISSDDSDLALFLNTESWTEDRKTAELTAMFPMLTTLDITITLRKTGDFGKAVDELLNIQGLEEAGLRQKGIDGFFNPEDDDGWAFSGKSKRRFRSEATENGKQKIAVNYRLKPLPADEIESSDAPTKPIKQNLSIWAPPVLPSRTATSASLPSPKAPTPGPTQWQTVKSKKKQQRSVRQAPQPETALSARSEARSAYAAAGQAARGGNHLYRAYAGILAERGSEANRNAHVRQREDWNAMVTKDENSIDLHGLPVLDGVRIALQRTQIWWESFDEDRAKKARANGFNIVVGMGNHSVGGVSRMRQHVWAALERHGWRANTYDGVFVVTGRR